MKLVNLVTQHKIDEVCNVNNTMLSNLKLSLEKPIAMSAKFLGEQTFIVAHVAIMYELSKEMIGVKRPRKKTNH
jgi:hypothetical protein